MAKLVLGWKNFNTCEDCAYHLNRDVINTIFYILAGISVNPFLSPYTFYWWLWNIWFIYCTSAHLHMLCFPLSLPLLLSIIMYGISLSEGEVTANAFFYDWKKNYEHDPNYHSHGESLLDIERTVKDERNKGNAKKDETAQYKTIEKERILNSLREETKKLNISESKFDDWSSTTAKDLAKIVSEGTAAEAQKVELCRQSESNVEEIARFELEQKELARKLIDTDSMKRKLGKKRKMCEKQMDEKLYELNIEKAKILVAIQKIKFELSRIDDYDKSKLTLIKESNSEVTNSKYDEINTLSKDIKEMERDLECPVCFELCAAPIYMCSRSHQICQECRPKMKVCPQCREPYKKNKIRHLKKEDIVVELQKMYKTLQENLTM